MKRTLLATGYVSWDAVERRSDRYGSIRLNDKNDTSILLDRSMDELEGKEGRLVAEVLIPVKSPHIGDLQRRLVPSTPELGEVVVLGTGSLFIEHRGEAMHESAEYERNDDRMLAILAQVFGNKLQISKTGRANVQESQEKDVYDNIGVRPDDGRTKDWLDPRAFYRLHLSKVNLYFEEQ
jgi:hypothetical protein